MIANVWLKLPKFDDIQTTMQQYLVLIGPSAAMVDLPLQPVSSLGQWNLFVTESLNYVILAKYGTTHRDTQPDNRYARLFQGFSRVAKGILIQNIFTARSGDGCGSVLFAVSMAWSVG